VKAKKPSAMSSADIRITVERYGLRINRIISDFEIQCAINPHNFVMTQFIKLITDLEEARRLKAIERAQKEKRCSI